MQTVVRCQARATSKARMMRCRKHARFGEAMLKGRNNTDDFPMFKFHFSQGALSPRLNRKAHPVNPPLSHFRKHKHLEALE